MVFLDERFKSINHALEVMNNRPNNKIMENCFDSVNNSYDFTGTNSYEEAVNLFKNGDEKSYKMLIKGFENIGEIKTINNIKRQIRNGVVGYAPNVPNAIMGLPNSMIYTEKKIMKSKTVSIMYIDSCSSFESAEDIAKAGATLLSAVNKLELNGYRVEIDLGFYVGKTLANQYARAFVKIKNFNEHLDLMKLAFPLVNPSMFRRFGFKWLETNTLITDEYFSHAYGMAVKDDFSKDNVVCLNMNMIRNLRFDVDRLLKEKFKK